jgi:hypothetical protein
MYCALHKIAPANNEKTFKKYPFQSALVVVGALSYFFIFVFFFIRECNRGQKQGLVYANAERPAAARRKPLLR